MDSGVGIAYGTSGTVVLEMGAPVARAKLKNLNFEWTYPLLLFHILIF